MSIEGKKAPQDEVVPPHGRRHPSSPLTEGTPKQQTMAGTPKSKSPKTRKAKSTGTKKAASSTGFPVGRIGSLLRRGSFHKRIGAGAPVFLAAVLEYVTAELMELAANAAKENKKSRITPRTIQLAVANDNELGGLFQNVTLASGGVVPNLRSALTEKKKAKKSKRKGGKKAKKSA